MYIGIPPLSAFATDGRWPRRTPSRDPPVRDICAVCSRFTLRPRHSGVPANARQRRDSGKVVVALATATWLIGLAITTQTLTVALATTAILGRRKSFQTRVETPLIERNSCATTILGRQRALSVLDAYSQSGRKLVNKSALRQCQTAVGSPENGAPNLLTAMKPCLRACATPLRINAAMATNPA